MLAARRADRERVGAEQPVLPPQGGIAGEALENTSAMKPASIAGIT